MKPFCGENLNDITRFTVEKGYEEVHASKTATNFYRKRISEIRNMKDLPGILRNYLASEYFSGVYLPVSRVISGDRTVKYLFQPYLNGEHETVFIPGDKRNTICVSTQSGCRMGCPYCLTGKMGLIRNLTAGEIVNQVYSIPESSKVTHVVFMGMGEPLDNLEEVLKACRILTAQWGFAISPLKITVSTVGVKSRINDFLEKSGCNLTLSLYSPFPEERLRMIPAETSNPSAEIIETMMRFSSHGKRRFSIAYMMISGVNDTERHLNELIRILKGSVVRVNLLPYHRINSGSAEPATIERVEYFKHMLVNSGISASVRRSRGNDIYAACGLLAAGHILK